MFKFTIFIFVFCFYNTGLLAMHPASPTDAPTSATAAVAPTHDVVVDLSDAFNKFVLADAPAHAPGVLATEEKSVYEAIATALNTRHDNFTLFMKEWAIRCRRNGIDLARVCSFRTPADRSLIDYAIFAGCDAKILQVLKQYGVPVNYIDSKKPTIETAWEAKNPNRLAILKWLITTDFKQPSFTISEGSFMCSPNTMAFFNCILDLQDRSPNIDLFNFCKQFIMAQALKNTPGLTITCMCGQCVDSRGS